MPSTLALFSLGELIPNQIETHQLAYYRCTDIQPCANAAYVHLNNMPMKQNALTVLFHLCPPPYHHALPLGGGAA